MKKLFILILMCLLLISWVVIWDLSARNRNLSNALKIAEDFLEESREEIDRMSNQIERLMRDKRAVEDWNKDMPDFR